MAPSNTLWIFLLLPALARQDNLESVMARVRSIHNFLSLFEELATESDRAVITVGIFQSFYLEPDDHKRLVDAVARFEDWLESMRQRGIIAYDAEEDPLVYLGPGDDSSTEDDRAMVRLLRNESPDVPEDPVNGHEIYITGFHPARALGALGIIATIGVTPPEELPEAVEDFTGLLRLSQAIFRLSFRHPERIHYEDWERELVRDYLRQAVSVTRQAVEAEGFPEEYWKSPAGALDRILKWRSERNREEL